MTNAGCSVFSCTRPGQLTWSTGESEAEHADWPICRTHHALLRSGTDWATYTDLPNSSSRWIFVGEDLEARNADALRAATTSVEYTATGKELEIEMTTDKATFDVIVDAEQATELVAAVAEITEDADIDAWDGIVRQPKAGPVVSADPSTPKFRGGPT